MMNDKKKSFVLYFDYLAHFEMLSKNEQADLIMTILRYVNGIDPDIASMSGAVRMAFSFIRKRLDEDYEKYLEVSKKRSLASKSNKIKQIATKQGDNDNVVVVYDNDNENVNEYDYENENVNDCVNEVVVVESVDEPHSGFSTTTPSTTTTTTVTRGMDFSVPTEAEVRDYCFSRNNTINPQRFIDYYNTNGWMVGKNPMKDWKAAVRIWETREITKTVREPPAPPPPPRSDSSLDIDEIDRLAAEKYRNL